jgi:uncharacterized protein (DUF58 family)
MRKKPIADLYIDHRWYLMMGIAVLLFVASFFFPWLYKAAIVFTCFATLLSFLDYFLLFATSGNIHAFRSMPSRFSLGDENKVTLSFANHYLFRVTLRIIDELPYQFQQRNTSHYLKLEIRGKNKMHYNLRPMTRGVYQFGSLLSYVSTPLGLLQRRITNVGTSAVKVYPSYQQLKKNQLLATSQNLFFGVKKIRRLGHSMEFEKIKSYVPGDDIRTINWKATARSTDIMVNTYTDARQQQVYAVIDKGRSMKMPFEGMTLLDYSINASLSLLNIVLLKHDKAGLITFSNTLSNIIPADRRTGQINHLIEALYKQETDFKESDYETLLVNIHRRISHRSFVLLFTNFETLSALERQLPYLKRMAERHLVCVVFFRNTLLKNVYENQPDTTEGIYIKTIAERFDYEKKLIVKELHRHGILSILTTPKGLNADVINKYIELKARQMV